MVVEFLGNFIAQGATPKKAEFGGDRWYWIGLSNINSKNRHWRWVGGDPEDTLD